MRSQISGSLRPDGPLPFQKGLTSCMFISAVKFDNLTWGLIEVEMWPLEELYVFGT